MDNLVQKILSGQIQKTRPLIWVLWENVPEAKFNTTLTKKNLKPKMNHSQQVYQAQRNRHHRSRNTLQHKETKIILVY